ncbi:MAG: hypothetical protein RSC06_16305 [Clostridia bacterium]
MPKLKQSDTQRICEIIRAKVQYGMKRKHLTESEIAIIWGVEQSTVSRRIKNLNKVQFGDLIVLLKRTGVKIIIEEDVKSCVIGGD